MAKENSVVNPFLRELFQLGVYKRSQGRLTRQATFAVLAITLALGAWRLSVQLADRGKVFELIVPAVVLALGVWICFRLVNLPKFADFLIAVEAEINKVSWPAHDVLFRSSFVVMFTIFFLAAILFFTTCFGASC